MIRHQAFAEVDGKAVLPFPLDALQLRLLRKGVDQPCFRAGDQGPNQLGRLRLQLILLGDESLFLNEKTLVGIGKKEGDLVPVPLLGDGLSPPGRRIDVIEEGDEKNGQKENGQADDHGKEHDPSPLFRFLVPDLFGPFLLFRGHENLHFRVFSGCGTLGYFPGSVKERTGGNPSHFPEGPRLPLTHQSPFSLNHQWEESVSRISSASLRAFSVVRRRTAKRIHSRLYRFPRSPHSFN